MPISIYWQFTKLAEKCGMQKLNYFNSMHCAHYQRQIVFQQGTIHVLRNHKGWGEGGPAECLRLLT